MYMRLYYKSKNDPSRKTICDVDVHTMDWNNLSNKKFWNIIIRVYFNIKNTLEFTMLNPSRILVEDLDSIQGIPEEYRDNKNDRFPQTRAYELEDKQLVIDKNIVIKEIRKRLQEIAERHGLTYDED